MRATRALIVATILAGGCLGGAAHDSNGVLAGLSEETVQRIAPRTTSILVMQGPENADERYYLGADRNTVHNTRSATKTVTAMLAGIAAGDNALRLVAPIWPHLGDLDVPADPLKAQITAGDLLTMSSALDCDDNDAQSPGNEENMYPRSEWARWAGAIPSDPGYERDQQGHGPFRYCTAGVVLLGHAIAQATAEPLDEFAQARLFSPIGVQSAQWSRSPSGEPMPGGGLELTSRDLARLGWLLIEEGRWDGRQVLPSGFVAAMLTEQRRANAEQGYGYLIWSRIYRTPCGSVPAWYMAGNGGNAVVLIPDHAAVVVVTRTAYNTRGMHQQTTALMEDVLLPRVVCGLRHGDLQPAP